MNSPEDFIGPVNLGNPCEFSVRQIAEMVIELTGSNSKLIFLPLPSDDPRQRQPDITLARSALSWEPKVALQDGLKETIGYFRNLLAS
jgi:UDP-glucuronate decarboxylase